MPLDQLVGGEIVVKCVESDDDNQQKLAEARDGEIEPSTESYDWLRAV